MNNSNDRRILYTKMFLREGILSLMKEKPIEKITPTALCLKTGIHRNTFYAHYNSTKDLLKDIEDELYEEVCRSIQCCLGKGISIEAFYQVNQVIYKNRDLCTILFSDFGDKEFLQRINDLLHDAIILEWKKNGLNATDEDVEILYAFYTGGSISIIKDWTQGDMQQNPQDIAWFCSKASHLGLQSFLKPRQ